MRRLLLALAAACLSLSAPGAIAAPAASSGCPAGQSYMGCSLPPSKLFATAPNPSGRPEFPDVSDNNGPVNWPKVKAWQVARHWTPAGMEKMGEFTIDSQARANAAALHTLGMDAIGYVFVRPGLKATTVLGWARELGIKVVVLDEEVLGIEGLAGELTPSLKAAGLTVIDYHSLGDVLDSSAQGLPCLVADYGPSSPPACTTGKTVAWQMTDTATVPGIDGPSDLSQALGILGLFGPADIGGAEHYERYDPTLRDGGISERRTVQSWDRDRCVNPVRRVQCQILRAYLQVLRARLVALHNAGKPWSYGSPSSIGGRNQELLHRITAEHVITSWKAGL